MPRPRAFALIQSVARGGAARLGVWLGVLALVVQLLVPLSQPRAAWDEEGLFPPTCSIHLNQQGAADLPSAMDCSQCPLCQLNLAARPLPLPERLAVRVFPVPQSAVFPETPFAAPHVIGTHPPLPSRGPPSVA